MRKHHASHDSKERADKAAGSGAASTTGMKGETFGDLVWSTISDMERTMEDTFRMPFGWDVSPVRHFFTDRLMGGSFVPTVDLMEGEKEIIIRAEIPGAAREDIDVRLVDHDLVISGEKRTEEKTERHDYLRMERTYGSFHRTLHLPAGIDGSHVAATLRDGVLEIRIPKIPEYETGRHIVVK